MTERDRMLGGKVVIVTGGAGLLGKEFIKTIIEQGGIGIIADINDENGNKVMRELQDEVHSANIDFISLDITAKASIDGLISVITKKFGKIDALVNNAYPRNKNYGKKFEEVSFKDFCDNLNTHLGGYFLMSQQLALFFKKQGHGNIINMSSIYGIMAPRFEVYENTPMTMPVEYAAIKSSIIHLTKYIAKYYKGYNIRVNSISPGGIIDQQPATFLDRYNSHCLSKGMLSIDDLKGTLIYLLSDLSRFVNGQNIIIDDGYTL